MDSMRAAMAMPSEPRNMAERAQIRSIPQVSSVSLVPVNGSKQKEYGYLEQHDCYNTAQFPHCHGKARRGSHQHFLQKPELAVPDNTDRGKIEVKRTDIPIIPGYMKVT